MKQNEDLSGISRRGLLRHSAVSWIEQCRNGGESFRECVKRASQLDWEGRFFSPRTLEDWYYAHRQGGFSRLQGRRRSDAGVLRALEPQVAEAILELCKSQPRLTVTAILERLRVQGIIEAGSQCSRSTVYRFLHQQGLDRHRLRALANEVGGPTKAWESDSPNALWMSDVMDGPSLKNAARAQRNALGWWLRWTITVGSARMRSFTLTRRSRRCWTVCVRVLSDADCPRLFIPIRGRSSPVASSK